MNAAHRIVAVVPLAWGEEAMLATLGAAQQVSADADCGYEVLLLGDDIRASAVPRVDLVGAAKVQLVVHDDLSDGENLPALASATAQALAVQNGQQILLVPP